MAGPRVPLSTLRPRPYGRRRMTRGRDDWLGLSRTTLSFVTLRRFSTAHCPSGGRAKSCPTSARVRVTANIERSSLALGEHCATLGEFVEWLAQRHDDF